MKKRYILFFILIITGFGYLFYTKKDAVFDSIQSSKLDKKNEYLIISLNKALADEWLAYYQYWIGAQVIQGAMKDDVIKELEEHANDELRHAKMISTRIIQLGGTPLLEPKAWYSHTICGYLAPNDFDERSILDQNIHGERCAIRVYKEILDSVKDSDLQTHKMIQEILNDEIEHEKDLQELFEKIKRV
jgi:bacterioferritin